MSEATFHFTDKSYTLPAVEHKQYDAMSSLFAVVVELHNRVQALEAELKGKDKTMSDAPERIWIEDERKIGGVCHVFCEDDPAHEYADEYVRADRIEELELAVRYVSDLAQQALDAREELEAKLAKIESLMVRNVKFAEQSKATAGSGSSKRREHYRMHALSEALGEIRKILKGQDDE